MNDSVVIILEEKLHELIADHDAARSEVNIAQARAHNIEMKVRALAKLIVRESAGRFSEEKILARCDLQEKDAETGD